MRTLIYAHRDHADAALAMVADLRADGVTALYRDTRAFDGDLERCDRVVTDDPAVELAYEAAGVEVVPFRAIEPEVPEDVPEPEPADADEGGDPDPQEPGEYRVEQSGPWYKLFGPDGEQVGKSQRSEDAAWALRDGED